MTITVDSISAILSEEGVARLSAKHADLDFSSLVDNLNKEVSQGQDSVIMAMKGDKEMMHRAILEINEAKSMLQLSVSIRDKIIEGYKEIMKMDV